MEPYQAVAVAVMIAMGFVVNSTMKLNKLRKKIDRMDDSIVKLLNERANLSLSIGKLKSEKGKSI